MKRTIAFFLCICAFLSAGHSQAVSFSNPIPWWTNRSPALDAKVHCDTSETSELSILLELRLHRDGRQARIDKTRFSGNEFTKDITFQKLPYSILGGTDFCTISWELTGDKGEGIIGPVGVVNLDARVTYKPVTIEKTNLTITADNAGAYLAEHLRELNGVNYGLAWNDSYFFCIVKKSAETNNTLSFCFDGENGKNAFVAYSDRFISYSPENNDVEKIRYSRSFNDKEITYRKTSWLEEITIESSSDITVIKAPWHDLAIIPHIEDGNRTIGFAVLTQDENGAVTSSYPDDARYYIPGTWGDLVLKK